MANKKSDAIYYVTYYAKVGEHGELQYKSSNFDAVFREGMDFYKRTKKEKGLGSDVTYIGVEGSGGDRFAVFYIDESYLKNTDESHFSNGATFKEWEEVAKSSLESGKPKKGKYSGVEKKEKGGKIPNNYKSKTAKEVWEAWNEKQRTHFLQDHFSTEDGATRVGKTFEDKADEMPTWDYEKLPDVVKDELRNHVSEGQYGGGGRLHTSYTNPIEYLKASGATVDSDLNFSTEKNGINFYIGRKGKKSLVVAFIEDENNSQIDKEDAREMSKTGREAGVETVELYTNYGIELHSKEKPKDIGFDKIYKVQVGEYEGGGILEQIIIEETAISESKSESIYGSDVYLNIFGG